MKEKNVIGIKFGVLGEDRIDKGSGKLIKDQLNAIIAQFNAEETPLKKIKIKIDTGHFSLQVKKLKTELKGMSVPVYPKSGSFPASVKGDSNAKNDKPANSAATAYKQATEALKAYQKALTQATRYDKPWDGYGQQLSTQTQEAKTLFETQVSGFKQSNALSEKELALLQRKRAEIEAVNETLKTQIQAKQQTKVFTQYAASIEKLGAKVSQMGNQQHAYLIATNKDAALVFSNLQTAWTEAQEAVNSGDYQMATEKLQALKNTIASTDSALNELEKSTDTIKTRFAKAFDSKIFTGLAYVALAYLARSLREVYQNVVKIDDAMTQLRIVTKRTETEYKKFGKTAAQAAQNLGASIDKLIDSTTVYARLGYSLKEASKFAELTTAYSNVSNSNVDEATTNITAIIKAYDIGANELENVLDKLIYVGNNFAVSSQELGVGMNNAASALAANGNSLEQAFGILAAANTVTQNIDKASTAVRTIAARISNSTADLEEFGGDTDGMASSTAALREELLALAKVDVYDSTGQLRSTYDILQDIASAWGSIDKNNRAAIATLVAGTRQQNVFYSLMENFQDAESVVSGAVNAAGELKDAQAAYLDSISGRIGQLNATWQDFSNNILNSDLIKSGIEVLTEIVKILDEISSWGDGFVGEVLVLTLAVSGLVALVTTIPKITFFKSMLDALKNLFPWISKVTGAIQAKIAAHNASKLASASDAATTTLDTAATLANTAANVGNTASSAASATAESADAAATTADTAAKTANTVATEGAAAANTAFNLTNPVGWIMLAVTAIYGLAKGLKYLSTEELRAAEEARERYEEAKKATEEQAKDFETLSEQIEKYKTLTEGIEDGTQFDAELRKQVLEIQRQITGLVSKEANGIDLVNGKLTEKYQLLAKLKAEEATNLADSALSSYYAAKKSKETAYEESLVNIGGIGWESLDGAYMIFQRGKNADPNADEIAKLITEASNGMLQDYASANIGDKYWGIAGVDGAKVTAEKMVETLDAVILQMKQKGYDITNETLFTQIKEYREAWNQYITQASKAAFDLLASSVEEEGWGKVSEGAEVNSESTYTTLRERLIKASNENGRIKKLIEDSEVTQSDIVEAVDNWLAANYRQWYDKVNGNTNSVILSLKSYLDILKDIQGEYDALSAAMDDMESLGLLSGDTVRELLEEYEGLSEYLELTASGYVLTEDALNEYLKAQRAEYKAAVKAAEGTKNYATAVENLANFDAVTATLQRSEAIKKYTEELEKQKEANNELLESQKNFRKDLLQTYKEEIDYQKELSKKQENVNALQTQLTLARLDTSAQGQARVRELESQLKQAQEDLDDYVLERAIETLCEEMDSEYDQYKKFIGEELKRIEEAIENAAEKFKNENGPVEKNDETIAGVVSGAVAGANAALSAQNNKKATSGSGGRINGGVTRKEFYEVSLYHSGGLVGDARVKNNEEFARLMKGELVATPAQMESFMSKTLPALLQNKSSGATYNAPLIEIQCDSITKDALPELKKMVNEAVKDLKSEIDSAFSRTGYRKPVNKFSI